MSNMESTTSESTPVVNPGNYSPVDWSMRDTVGAFFLGILSVILLIGWMRSEKRVRTLLAQREASYGNDQLEPG